RAVLHPDRGLIVALTIAQALDRLIQVVRRAVRIDVDDLDGDIGILRAGGDVEGRLDRAADFDPVLQGLRGVDQNVRAGFHFALIEGASGDGIAGAADVAAVRGDGIHRVVVEAAGCVRGRRRAGEPAVAGEGVGLAERA